MPTLKEQPTYSKEELLWQEREWRKCFVTNGGDFGYWVDTYGHMWIKEGGDEVAFKLWKFQWDAAENLQGKQKLIFLKARQMGLSWLVSAYALWSAMRRKNFHVYYTSIGLKEIQEQMARVRFIFNYLPDWMKQRSYLGGKDCKDNDQIIEFTNGSALHSVSSGKSSGHGSAPGLLICDEWSRVQEAVEKWRALSPARGKKTQVVIISTSDGLNNHFADMWIAATNGANDYYPIFYAASEHPDYSAEYLEEQRREFIGDEQGYKASFPMTPEDAFLSSSRAVFSQERIKEWRDYISRNDIVPSVGIVEPNNENDMVFTEDSTGFFQMWVEPTEGHHYTLGVDVSQGLINGDWSVIAVYDTTTNEIVGLYRAKISPELYSYPILNIAKYYNNAWVCVEVNTASELLISDLKAVYPWIYMRQQRARITDLPTLVPGFYSSATSKPRIILAMRRLFMDVDESLRIYSTIILDEMAQYEQSDKGGLSAPKGAFDDCVMAVALAIEAQSTMPFTDMDYSLKAQHKNRTLSWRAL